MRAATQASGSEKEPREGSTMPAINSLKKGHEKAKVHALPQWVLLWKTLYRNLENLYEPLEEHTHMFCYNMFWN